MVNLVSPKYGNKVFDPFCGTGGFLISAMHEMVQKIKESNIGENSKQNKIKNIKQKQLHGIELQPIECWNRCQLRTDPSI